MDLPEDDEVREVRPGEQERAHVQEQDAPVEQEGFAFTPAPRRVHEDGCQKGDRRVQVEQGCDCGYKQYGPGVEDEPVPSHPGQEAAGGGEQAVLIRDQADQEEARDQYERRPILCCCRAGFVGAGSSGREGAQATQPGRYPRGGPW